ncbi:spore coat protein [Paenibacillus sp. 1P03SA]|uniref:spore coat protein n=1 Tax=Paenibacillus sp. 1P03SA TaxID=3132294 RepID=UPI0039A24706
MKQELQTDQAGEKQWEAAERTMADFKRLASRYASAAWDARQPGIRALYRQLLQQTLNDQDRLYRLLAARVDKKKVQNASGEDVLQEIASHDRALSELEAAIRKDFAGMEAEEADPEASAGAALYDVKEETAVFEPIVNEEKELEIFGERPDYYSSLSTSSVYDSSYGDVYHSELSAPEEEDFVSVENAEIGAEGPYVPEQPASAVPAQPAAAPVESSAFVHAAPSRFGGAPAPATPEQPASAVPAQPAAAPVESSAFVHAAPSRFGGAPAPATPEQPAPAAPMQPAAAPVESSAYVHAAPSRFGGAPAPATPEQPASAAHMQPAAAPARPYAASRSPYGGPATNGAAPYGTPAAAALPVAYRPPASPPGVPVGASYGGLRSPAPARAPYGQSLPQPGQPPGYGQPYTGRQPQQQGSPTQPAAPSAQQPYPSRYREEGGGRPLVYRPQG